MFKSKESARKIEHIYSKDPAIDQDAESYDHAKYVETRDEQYLPRKNGVQPVKFLLQPPTGTGRERLKWAITELLGGDLTALEEPERVSRVLSAYYELAVRCVVGAVGAYDENGKDVEIATGFDRKEQCRKLTEKSIAALVSVDNGDLFYELGARAMREVNGDPTSGKG